MSDVIEDPVLKTLIEIAGEIVALQALDQLAMKSDIHITKLDDHMRILNGLRDDVTTAMAARILLLADTTRYSRSPTYGKESDSG